MLSPEDLSASNVKSSTRYLGEFLGCAVMPSAIQADERSMTRILLGFPWVAFLCMQPRVFPEHDMQLPKVDYENVTSMPASH